MCRGGGGGGYLTPPLNSKLANDTGVGSRGGGGLLLAGKKVKHRPGGCARSRTAGGGPWGTPGVRGCGLLFRKRRGGGVSYTQCPVQWSAEDCDANTITRHRWRSSPNRPPAPFNRQRLPPTGYHRWLPANVEYADAACRQVTPVALMASTSDATATQHVMITDGGFWCGAASHRPPGTRGKPPIGLPSSRGSTC